MELQDHAWNPLTSTEINKEDRFCELGMVGGGVYILSFIGESRHRFSQAAICLIDKLLDQGKFFSDGMDVSNLRCTDRESAIGYLMSFQKLVGKLLTFHLPTMAVIRGHAVGAGCIFALAHDYRLMSSDHGHIFMNGVNLGMSLTPGIMSVLRTKLPISTFQERYSGKGTAAAGIVQATCPGTTLMQEGMKKALEHRARRWNREIYHALKMEMFKTTLQELENGGIGYARM
ncbi:enoyl-CoA delta isomerase 2, peroxisomal-like [Rhodamnia argentea]|uniref:Enoyl-CoA delta isomerase 2, peroxisomal-like n=1 Tax=Rhodamnia argentea TaxID=178133 RepID=A0ABM3GYQ9_9MYRT|nr:enoyl-CoA delta isomerase 2, peroxisomal-like [Rhodamnia argentea]